MNHGSGGLLSQQLIRDVFIRQFNNPRGKEMADSAVISSRGLAITTDSYVIDPLIFPGGDIGKLAVCGTVNDLAVSGADPAWLTAGFILEEGLRVDMLEQLVASMAREAREAGVEIVAGDTKVVPRGKADRLFINTAGVGFLHEGAAHIAGGKTIQPGDHILINGSMGDHAIAVLSARENLPLKTAIQSDCACLHRMMKDLLKKPEKVKFARDLTRGGLATILNEVCYHQPWGMEIREKDIPVKQSVAGVCEMVGFDPLYLANEGKLMLIVDPAYSEECLSTMKKYRQGADACIIGQVTEGPEGKVLLKTNIGGRRILDVLAGDQLPRIC